MLTIDLGPNVISTLKRLLELGEADISVALPRNPDEGVLLELVEAIDTETPVKRIIFHSGTSPQEKARISKMLKTWGFPEEVLA